MITSLAPGVGQDVPDRGSGEGTYEHSNKQFVVCLSFGPGARRWGWCGGVLW
jgi:hypothetical protein